MHVTQHERDVLPERGHLSECEATSALEDGDVLDARLYQSRTWIINEGNQNGRRRWEIASD